MPEAGYRGYGLGLAKVETRCQPAWGHEGQLPGFVSAAWHNQSNDRQVVVLGNATVDSLALTLQKVITPLFAEPDDRVPGGGGL